jgi:para-aminobenzoate synthetase component 1
MVLPYEYLRSLSGSGTPGGERPIAWKIGAALIWENNSLEPQYLNTPEAPRARFHLDQTKTIKSILADATKVNWQAPSPIDLLPTTSDDTYLDTVRQIIRGISEGHFYQINFLRYFHAYKSHGWDNLCHLMELRSGPFGSMATLGSKVFASFSPERFVEVDLSIPESARIRSWPIKGTAPRYPSDPAADQESGNQLKTSAKDRAELRIIIDLMRNDLHQICEAGSVTVESDGDLKKFSHVWHLEGEVAGSLKTGLTWRDLLKALCPAGSITGAPKIAAMNRIQADEGRERGFFMGNTFTIFGDGSMRSSVNIRTLTSDNWVRSAHYAAGSGIVIKSDPMLELNEIESKTNVLTMAQEASLEL